MKQLGHRLSGEEVKLLLEEDGALLSLLNAYGLLIISDFTQDIEAFENLAAAFGCAELVSPPVFGLAGHPTVRVQSNLPGQGVSGGGEYWHSDGPWSATPSAVTLLLCEIAPSGGGETLFTDMREVVDSAPPELRAKLEPLVGNYPCRAIYQRELEQMGLRDPDKLAELQDLCHPIVRRHPRNGRSALYLNEKWLVNVIGLSDEESTELLTALLDMSTDPDGVYAHTWQANDVLIWDNVAMMHKALPPAEGSSKKTYRITIKG